jgi:hypothetical protein
MTTCIFLTNTKTLKLARETLTAECSDGIKPTHIAEAIAAGLGFRTHRSLLARLDAAAGESLLLPFEYTACLARFETLGAPLGHQAERALPYAIHGIPKHIWSPYQGHAPAHFLPGSFVRVPDLEAEVAIVATGWQRDDDMMLVFADTGLALCLKTDAEPIEAVTDFVPGCLRLPYGKWREPDGSDVYFSRDYCPLWRVRPGGRAEPVDPWDRIKIIDTMHYWTPAATPYGDPALRAFLERLLVSIGATNLPRLAAVMPVVMANRTISIIKIATERLAPNAYVPEEDLPPRFIKGHPVDSDAFPA